MADDYALTHKSSFVHKSTSRFQSKSQSKSTSDNSQSTPDKKPSNSSDKTSSGSLPSVSCKYCKKPGHLISECYTLKRKQQWEESKPNAFIRKESLLSKVKQSDLQPFVSDSVMEDFEPFITDGFV